MDTNMKIVEKRTWAEFRSTGLLLFVNSFLQIFGWSIAVNIDDDGDIETVYPIRTSFRGFSENNVDEAYQKLADYMVDNAVKIKDEGYCGFLTKED